MSYSRPVQRFYIDYNGDVKEVRGFSLTSQPGGAILVHGLRMDGSYYEFLVSGFDTTEDGERVTLKVTSGARIPIPGEVVTFEGPAFRNVVGPNFATFEEFSTDVCRGDKDGNNKGRQHDWSGPFITISAHETCATCAFCGLDFGTWGLRNLP